MMTARHIENEIRDFSLCPKKERKGSKGRKANGVEDAVLHSALRLSLQRILRETPPSDAAKSRDFSVYTGALWLGSTRWMCKSIGLCCVGRNTYTINNTMYSVPQAY